MEFCDFILILVKYRKKRCVERKKKTDTVQVTTISSSSGVYSF